MRAFIDIHLSRPSLSGRTVINKTIVADRDNIVDKVNEFIDWRISKHDFIPVDTFKVRIKNNRNDKVVNEWEYNPKYMDEKS